MGATEVKKGWIWWSGIAAVLSLGPVLKLFGVVITVPLPELLVERVQAVLDWLGTHSFAQESFPYNTAIRGAIPLPALFLRWFIPGLAGMRSWGRFALFAGFGVAVLAGEGLIAGIDKAREDYHS